MWFYLGFVLQLGFGGIAAAQLPSSGISVLNGTITSAGGRNPQVVAPVIQALCAEAAEQCDIFCSEDSLGRAEFKNHTLCRVTWRCPDGNVRSVEASKDEIIPIRCLRVRQEQLAVDQLPPLTYSPPAN